MVKRAAVRLALGACCAASAGSAFAADPIEFDRPGVGFSASVLAPGQVAWEQGLPDVERDADAGVRTTSRTFGSVLRVGLGASLELQLAGAPRERLSETSADDRLRQQGAGDSRVGLKWALPATGDLDWALLAQYGLRTGSAGLRPQRHARRLGASVGGETAGGRGFSVFAGYARDDEGAGWQLAPSLDVHAGETVGAYVEAVLGSGAERGVRAGGGLTWQPRGPVQFDVSVMRGLGGDVSDWTGGLGVSVGWR